MPKFTEQDIEFIQNRACERITELLDALGMDYTERNDYLQASCPVHGGDNQRAMFWAMRSGHWQCKTRECHKDPITGPSNSIFGLVRGTMGRKTEKKWSFYQSVCFVAHVLGLKISHDGQTDSQDIEIFKLLKQHRNQKKQTIDQGLPLSSIVSRLQEDTTYYPNRGVSRDIIAKYHISSCETRGKPMYKRSFFPVLDYNGRYVIGWSGRSIYDQCSECGTYHDQDRHRCPDQEYLSAYTKWKHSKDFRSELALYNIWHAKSWIQKTGAAIVCEGPGDVWACETADIRNSVALCGISMSKHQRLMLQNAGALTLILAFDNDKAGLKAMEHLQDNLMYYFRIFCVTPDTVNDIADMFTDDLVKKITPILARVSKSQVLTED